MVSKAFAVGYRHDFFGTLICINLIRKKMDTASQKFEILRTIENLRKNPQMTKEVYALYAGDSMPKEEIPEGLNF